MAKVGVWADHTQVERLSDYLRTSIWLVHNGTLAHLLAVQRTDEKLELKDAVMERERERERECVCVCVRVKKLLEEVKREREREREAGSRDLSLFLALSLLLTAPRRSQDLDAPGRAAGPRRGLPDREPLLQRGGPGVR